MKKKILLNDPIYGFIEVPYPGLYEIINHPYFQRLRNIRQLGMTQLVYPGAIHSRFQHAIGAMYLTHKAVETLQSKGIKITDTEAFSVCAAVLMHDMGHGPFSHSLEGTIVDCHHEDITRLFFKSLNAEMNGKLSIALKIFEGKYHKKFLCQLVSGQLDMDRLDYLNRDSFFCGVSEGIISSDRIIKMLDVAKGELAIEAKGIYSVENFIIARRLMYWQVYLHKTVLGAENVLVNILTRARELYASGHDLFVTQDLWMFLTKKFTIEDLQADENLFANFASLDDSDIYSCVKSWAHHPDQILSTLSEAFVYRRLFKTEIHNAPIAKDKVSVLKKKAIRKFGIPEKAGNYFVITGNLENKAYNPKEDKINIVHPDGKVLDIARASDYLSISILAKPVKKYFLSYPKNL